MKTTVLIISGVALSFYLLTEHQAHLFGNVQYILLGAFILAHLFMHAGHGEHGKDNTKGKGEHHG
jgi:hypothetical protein